MVTKPTSKNSVEALRETVERLQSENAVAMEQIRSTQERLNANQVQLERAQSQLREAEAVAEREARERHLKELGEDLAAAHKIAEQLNEHVSGVVACWQTLRDLRDRHPELRSKIQILGEVQLLFSRLPVCLLREDEEEISMEQLGQFQIQQAESSKARYPEIFAKLSKLKLQ